MAADHRRIHELEYELGFRADPPPANDPADIKFGPGMIIPITSDRCPECHVSSANGHLLGCSAALDETDWLLA